MVKKLISRFCCNVRYSIKGKLRLLQFLAEKNLMFVCLAFFLVDIYLSSVGELLLQKTALVRITKKEDCGVKKKSSNVTLS